MVDAMPKLPDVHVALVINQPGYANELTAKARKLGVADRLHVLPYVPADQVVDFLSGADAGVIPIRHFPNHEIALITKFFEYSHARLPIVVSDVKTMAATVRGTGRARCSPPTTWTTTYARSPRCWPTRRATGPRTTSRACLRVGPGRPRPGRWSGCIEVCSDEPADVTVVTAVYNTMPYLKKCLRTLVNQTIGADRLEIVAVDDGSTDGGGEWLDRFAEKHPGVVKVIHQANSGGPAVPSNRGLDAATGRYVFFIGSDDYLGKDALRRLVAKATRSRRTSCSAAWSGSTAATPTRPSSRPTPTT